MLIYDGECNLCSNFIRFVIRINKNPRLFITDFNSNWTKENIHVDPNVDSMIFISNDERYIYSDSIINLLKSANKLFYPLVLAKLIPRTVRDAIYRVIARNRRKLFLKKTCPLPSQTEKRMFLN
ncbi:thiol-disulfide oxidoreductase DCC family protein [Terribacillus saccharophilus]|uniref:thiol-disulfide oxidoreductase DCC family protein n=1 Tax=Terribacillus saccharophilus TaxID=361277 RepID=UPI0039824CA1